MGPDTTYAEGVGCIPQQGGPQADGTEIAEGTGWRIGLPPTGGCDGGGAVSVGRDLSLPPPEHRGTIYCDQVHYRPVSGGKAEDRAKSENAVVGTGGYGFGEDADGGPGGGADGGGGED